MEAGPGRPGDADRGSADRFRRLPAAQFRHELPGRRQRQAGAAAVAQRAGRAPARRRRPGPPHRPLPPGRRDAAIAAGRTARPGHRAWRRRRHAARPRPALHRPVQWRPGQAAARRHRAGRQRRRRPAAWFSMRRPPGRSPTSWPGVRPPEGAPARGIAYKTGTSYGYRDAWSIGFDGRYVLGVWIGRPDAAAIAGLSGYVSAAPGAVRGLCQIRPCGRAAARRAGRRVPPEARGAAGDHGALRIGRRADRRRTDRTGAADRLPARGRPRRSRCGKRQRLGAGA